MRISTTLGILKRALDGQTPEGIAARMHLGRDTVAEVLERAGWPDLAAVRAWKAIYLKGGNEERALGETASQLAKAVRVNPEWVDEYTDWRTHQQLSALVKVMAKMLDENVDHLAALRWQDHSRAGRPKREAA